MEYVVVGAGSLGQSFAALLTLAGEDVTLVATPRSAERLLASGAITLTGVVDAVVTVAQPTPGARNEAPRGAPSVVVTTSPADIPRAAQVLFTTKGHDLPAAIAAVHSAAAECVSWAAGVQNGIVKDDLLANAFGAERVVGAVTIFGAALLIKKANMACPCATPPETMTCSRSGHESIKPANFG